MRERKLSAVVFGRNVMKRKITLRGKKRTAQKWGDVRISGSGKLYIKPGDVLRRRVRALLQKKRGEKPETAA